MSLTIQRKGRCIYISYSVLSQGISISIFYGKEREKYMTFSIQKEREEYRCHSISKEREMYVSFSVLTQLFLYKRKGEGRDFFIYKEMFMYMPFHSNERHGISYPRTRKEPLCIEIHLTLVWRYFLLKILAHTTMK